MYSWADLDAVCSLKSDFRSVPGGSAGVIYKQPIAALLAGCGSCTRLTCLPTFHLEDVSGAQQGPTNHHFLCSPKEALGLQRANITVSAFISCTYKTLQRVIAKEHRFSRLMTDTVTLSLQATVQEDKSNYTITLHSASIAPFVWLDVGNIPGRFSSNGFLMVSGRVTVSFKPWRPTSVAELSDSLSVTSLRDVY